MDDKIINNENKQCATLKAYKMVKSKILNHKLNSRRLSENELAKELQLSRTPVREALIMLEQENILFRQHGKGFQIRPFSMKDIKELYEYRRWLELSVAEAVIRNATEEDVDELNNLLNKNESLIDEGKIETAFAEGVKFHQKCNRLCNNSFMIKALDECYDKFLLIGWACQDKEICIDSAKEHKEILIALKQKDLKGFQQNIEKHYIHGKNRAMNILSKQYENWYLIK